MSSERDRLRDHMMRLRLDLCLLRFRAIIKRDLVQSEGFACKEEKEDEGSSPLKRLATSSSLSFDEEPNLIINENNQVRKKRFNYLISKYKRPFLFSGVTFL